MRVVKAVATVKCFWSDHHQERIPNQIYNASKVYPQPPSMLQPEFSEVLMLELTGCILGVVSAPILQLWNASEHCLEDLGSESRLSYVMNGRDFNACTGLSAVTETQPLNDEEHRV